MASPRGACSGLWGQALSHFWKHISKGFWTVRGSFLSLLPFFAVFPRLGEALRV